MIVNNYCKLLGKLNVLCVVLCFSICPQIVFSANVVSSYALSPNGQALIKRVATSPRTPASIQKIINAQLSLDKWGAEHRFETEFYLHDDWLWVKGRGDPYLVSEELDRVVESILQVMPSLTTLKGIGVDSSYFENVQVDGRDGRSDPYNAPLSAVAVNFNTIFVRIKNGQVFSAEPQTPLTPLARKLAAQLPNGKHRVNLVNSDRAKQYFAELLQVKFNQRGVSFSQVPILGLVPAEASILIRYRNSRNLAEILRGSLEYSNNFIANQLFIQLCDGEHNALSMQGASLCARQQLLDRYPAIFSQMTDLNMAWQIVDGAGLSRQNKISASMLVQILDVFEPHKALLKSYHNGRVRAKTGTLNQLRTMAGYVGTGCGDVRFAFFFEGEAVYGKREAALKRLIRKIDANREFICK